MAQAPTFKELEEWLLGQGFPLKTSPTGVQYFQGQVGNKILTYPISFNGNGNDWVGLWVVKSICNRFKLDASRWGLTM